MTACNMNTSLRNELLHVSCRTDGPSQVLQLATDSCDAVKLLLNIVQACILLVDKTLPIMKLLNISFNLSLYNLVWTICPANQNDHPSHIYTADTKLRC